jgi:diguanylate cyclase (GGDEF)-like protein
VAASTDYLTGLANRRTLTKAGETRLLAGAGGASAARLAVAVLDIDHFKAINDRHGHDVGDEALKHVAALIDRVCRGRGQCGRHGGEEFVALLDNVDTESAFAAAELLRSTLQDEPFRFAGGELTITASVGVAVAHLGDRRIDDLLRRADQALYRAKARGRNRVEVA